MNITATVGKSTDIKHNLCNERKNRMAETAIDRFRFVFYIKCLIGYMYSDNDGIVREMSVGDGYSK